GRGAPPGRKILMNTLLLLAAAIFCRHEESITSSRIEISGSEATVTFTLSMEDLGAIDTAAFDYISKHYGVWNDGVPCRAELVTDVVKPATFTPKSPVCLVMR